MGMEEEDEELKKLMWLKTMGVITPLVMEEAQAQTQLKAHQHVKLGQSLEPWLRSFKKIGILPLMAEKRTYTYSRRHRL